MNNIKIKKIVWYGVIGVAIFLIFGNFNKNQQDTDLKETSTQLGIRLNKVKTTISLKKAKNIEWRQGTGIEPEKIKAYSSAEKKISQEEIINFLELTGLSQSESTNSGSMVIINNGLKSAYIDPVNKILSYEEKIEDRKQLKDKVEIPTDAIVNRFVKDGEGLVKPLKIVVSQTKFLKTNYPLWVESTEKEADVVEITAVYDLEGKELVDYFGFPIKAVYTKGGKMISIKLKYPPVNINEAGDERVLSDGEIKKLDIGEYLLWNIDSDASELPDKLENVVINQSDWKYIFDGKNSKILPYYFLQGTAVVENRPARVTMIVPASRQE